VSGPIGHKHSEKSLEKMRKAQLLRLGRPFDLVERFWSYVDKSDEVDGCWTWMGATDRCGYGIYSVHGRNVPAHRFSWELAFGKIPKGMCILHKCDDFSCVNPDHFVLGTWRDVSQSRVAKGRQAYGEKVSTVKLDREKVREIRSLYGMGIPQMEISRRMNLRETIVNDVIRGRTWRHVEWDTPLPDERLLAKHRRKFRKPFSKERLSRLGKEYLVQYLAEFPFKVRNLEAFCKEHNLDCADMCSVASGKQKQYRGWRCRRLP